MNQKNISANGNLTLAMSLEQYHFFVDKEYKKLKEAISAFSRMEVHLPISQACAHKKQIEDLKEKYNNTIRSIEIVGNFDLSSLQMTQNQKRVINVCFKEYHTTESSHIFETNLDNEYDFSVVASNFSMKVQESPESSHIMYAYNDEMHSILIYHECDVRLVVYNQNNAYKKAKERFLNQAD